MLSNFIKGRVYVFIDAANILYSQQTLGWRVDYGKLKRWLERECALCGLFFYTGHVGDNEKQQSFLQKLQGLGYSVKSKEVKRIRLSDNTYILKGNLDVELTIDVMKSMQNFDTMVLMSGDSDFAPLLDEVRMQKKRVIVMSTKGRVARELLERAKYVNLKKLRQWIEFGGQSKIPPPCGGERCDTRIVANDSSMST